MQSMSEYYDWRYINKRQNEKESENESMGANGLPKD